MGKKAQPARKVRYSAVVLDDESRERLVTELNSYLEPLLAQGWVMRNSPPPPIPVEQLPHHMTICLGPLTGDLLERVEREKRWGETQSLTAVQWGQSDLAAAVMVLSHVPSTNEIPHITVAVSPNGKPFHSNQIPLEAFKPLSKQIFLTGTVQEVE